MSVLNSIGLCSSYWTVECLKQALTDYAIQHAQGLITSGTSFFSGFDNIHVYLRKFDQRLTNKNTMLSLTNTMIIALPDAPPSTFALQLLLDLRGNCSKATTKEMKISIDEGTHMVKVMTAIAAQLIVAFCPGSSNWPDYDTIKRKVVGLTPWDRPLPPKKTQTFPFGIFY